MAFDIGNGLSSMGTAVAATAGAYTLEAQKAELEMQKVKLADELAGGREEKQRGFLSGESEKERGSREKIAGETNATHLEVGKMTSAASMAHAGATLTAAREHITAQLQIAGSAPHVGDDGTAFTINPKTGAVKPMTLEDGSPLKLPDPVEAKSRLEALQSYSKDKTQRLNEYKTEPWLVVGPQGIGPERMLDIGDDQLLVLLLVIQPQLKQLQKFNGNFALQERLNAFVDMVAITENLIQFRT